MAQLTFLSEEPPASRSVSPALEKDWQTRVATWRSNIYALLIAHGEESAARTGFSVAGAVTHGYGSKLGTDESCQGSVIAVQSVNTPREKRQNGIGVNDSGAMYSLTARDQHAVAYQTSGNCGAWETGAITGALDTNTDPNSHVICFSAKDYGQDALANCAPTLRAGGHSGSHENGGVMPAVAFAQNSRDELREMPYVGALAAEAGMKQTSYIRQSHVVRRLTPLECERLQGFPDYYTLIQRRGKPAADAPRYKALGNSMAVPVMRWLGTRIAAVEAISERLAA